MELVALPAFTDNYIWMIHDGREALVVDPGEATPVTAVLQQRGLRLTGILVTHHHGDHVGGIDELRAVLQGPVFGPAHERTPEPCIRLHEGDVAEWNGLRFRVIDVPGHTSGHIAYCCASFAGGPVLFCGDTLFSAGCGRLFEGTPAQMHASLAKLAALPDATRVCCTHEYTLANLKFAKAVEPSNDELIHYFEHCERLRAQGLPTLPSSIGQEKRINPFLRTRHAAVAQAAQAHGAADPGDEVAVFAALRQWKNEFR